MRERHNRLAVVKELIRNNRIDNQDMLLDLLKEEGYNVTQATLSRDLKMLKVGKISDGWSGDYYSLPASDLVSESASSALPRWAGELDMAALRAPMTRESVSSSWAA